MSLSREQFIEWLVASGVMSAEEVGDFEKSLPAEKRPADAQRLARLLVQHRKLTKYQAAAVYQGKTNVLVLGNYVILDKIGAGGMGQVYKALHRRMERVVALKVLPAEATSSPEAVQRFHREVKAAARLEHPNIVTAHDADEADGMHFLVMQYVDGKDLSELLKERGPFPVPEAAECIRQAACGLAYAHRQGVVHRDIKPGNLILARSGRIHPAPGRTDTEQRPDESGHDKPGPDKSGHYEQVTIKILDMGLARLESQVADQTGVHGITHSGQVMGTVDYMSPEQAAESRDVDHRTDIYSLGCTLYVLLTGQPLYTGATAIAKLIAHRTSPVPSLRAARADVPEALEPVYQKMVAKDPAERYQSMDEVIADLATRLGDAPPAELEGASSSDSRLTEFFRQIAGDNKVASRASVSTNVVAETLPPQSLKEETGMRHPGGVPPVTAQSALGPSAPLPTPTAPRRKGTPWLLIGTLAGGGVLAIPLLAVLVWLLLPGDDRLANPGKDEPRRGEGAVASEPRASYALEFDGDNDYVEIPTLSYTGGPFTIEARVRAERPRISSIVVGGGRAKMSLHAVWDGFGFHAGVSGVLGRQEIRGLPSSDDWRHVAGVWDGCAVHIFVDGQPASGPQLFGGHEPGPRHFFLGAQPDGETAAMESFFSGAIDEVRISKTARYTQAFIPPKRFHADGDTVALYAIDEGQGEVLNDSSGNEHHGKIVGTKWVKASGGRQSPEFSSAKEATVDLLKLIVPARHALEPGVRMENGLLPTPPWNKTSTRVLVPHRPQAVR